MTDKRIHNHPILGNYPFKKEIFFYFNNKKLIAFEGETIAAALLANGIKVFKKSKKNKENRSLLCGIGRCNDCMMTVNGQQNVKTCINFIENQMKVEISKIN